MPRLWSSRKSHNLGIVKSINVCCAHSKILLTWRIAVSIFSLSTRLAYFMLQSRVVAECTLKFYKSCTCLKVTSTLRMLMNNIIVICGCFFFNSGTKTSLLHFSLKYLIPLLFPAGWPDFKINLRLFFENLGIKTTFFNFSPFNIVLFVLFKKYLMQTFGYVNL